eukprot:gene2516-biopygen1328
MDVLKSRLKALYKGKSRFKYTFVSSLLVIAWVFCGGTVTGVLGAPSAFGSTNFRGGTWGTRSKIGSDSIQIEKHPEDCDQMWRIDAENMIVENPLDGSETHYYIMHLIGEDTHMIIGTELKAVGSAASIPPRSGRERPSDHQRT